MSNTFLERLREAVEESVKFSSLLARAADELEKATIMLNEQTERADELAADKGTYFRLYEQSCIQVSELKQRVKDLEAWCPRALEVCGTVYFKGQHQYRSQMRFPVKDGAYELVRVEPYTHDPLDGVKAETYEFKE